ncbi:MAG: TIGR02147 family protein [Deltaproteobacteria bacterium]|nr:TIGR02147 family protein [Deltaproteobacteria bacterium]
MQDATPKIPRVWLENEFARRRQANPAYSLRAFARQLELPPGRLSEILSDKRNVTRKVAEKIAERLGFDPAMREEFLGCVRRGPTDLVSDEHRQLSLDAYQAISDWHHYAILSLTELDDFEYDVGWIARRLGISTVDARAAVERLLRLELAEERDGTLARTQAKLLAGHDVSSPALRKRHERVLRDAIEALGDAPSSARDVTSVVVATDPAKIPEAKAMIRRFRRKLCAFLESGAKKEVYNLNVQLVPVTKKG